MKKLLLLAFICSIAFFACKKTSDSSKDITGKWVHTKGVRVETKNGIDSIQSIKNITNPDDYIFFNKNGTFAAAGTSSGEVDKYTLSGNTLTLSFSSDSSHAVLILKVKTLTSNNLVLRQEAAQNVDGVTFSEDNYYSKQ